MCISIPGVKVKTASWRIIIKHYPITKSGAAPWVEKVQLQEQCTTQDSIGVIKHSVWAFCSWAVVLRVSRNAGSPTFNVILWIQFYSALSAKPPKPNFFFYYMAGYEQYLWYRALKYIDYKLELTWLLLLVYYVFLLPVMKSSLGT